MVIIYKSKTGFTKKYAEMLSAKTGLEAFTVKELAKVNPNEEIVFLGWLKVGKIQGLDKLKKYNIKVVCGSGTARTAEPDAETIITRNKIKNTPFFYLRGGCLPLKDLKGMDKVLMSMFVKMLRKRKDKDERVEESISIIENGFNGVDEENLTPLLAWLNTR